MLQIYLPLFQRCLLLLVLFKLMFIKEVGEAYC